MLSDFTYSLCNSYHYIYAHLISRFYIYICILIFQTYRRHIKVVHRFNTSRCFYCLYCLSNYCKVIVISFILGPIEWDLPSKIFGFDSKTPSVIGGLLGLLCYSLELLVYIYLFMHFFQHDNKKMKHLLSQDIRKHRTRKNTITLSGQIFTFLAKLITLTSLLAVHSFSRNNVDKYYDELASALIVAKFPLYAIVEIITSMHLKSKL